MFQCTDAFVTLAAVDLEKLVQFYTELLDQKPQPYILSNYAEFRLPGLRLGIFKPRDTHQPEFETPSYPSKEDLSTDLERGKGNKGGMSLCLEVSDLEDAIAHLAFLGYPPSGEIIAASHGREIYAYDPAGNRLILHQSWVDGQEGSRG
jgi:catechol 2,3-dioxygenase-like lactoylglutathione lyase family enzyme